MTKDFFLLKTSKGLKPFFENLKNVEIPELQKKIPKNSFQVLCVLLKFVETTKISLRACLSDLESQFLFFLCSSAFTIFFSAKLIQSNRQTFNVGD